jgi:hypothetical protein
MGLEYDFVKVLDFGLVKVRQKGAPPLTATIEHTTGTGLHGAGDHPGEANVDRRADAHALGCVIYYR